MFGSSILEVAIGVIFVYLTFSLIVSAINEGIATLINKRGKTLFEGIKNLLNDPEFTGLAQQLYTHGLVDGISREASNKQKARRLPSYMPSNTFVLALLDILASCGVGESWQDVISRREMELEKAKKQRDDHPGDPILEQAVADAQTALDKAEQGAQQATDAKNKHAEAAAAATKVKTQGRNKEFKDLSNIQEASKKLEEALAVGRVLAAQHPDPLGNIQKAVEELPVGHTRESLLVLIDKTRQEATTVADQVAKLRENIEQWFNDAMDRVSGWYKRWTQIISLVVACMLVFVANADTLMLAKRLTRDGTLRASVVAAANQTFQNATGNSDSDQRARQDLLRETAELNLPFGWIPLKDDPYNIDQVPETLGGWLLKVFGLLLSVSALTMGAPFWFDILKQFVNLRGAGPPPGENKKGMSNNEQRPT